MSCDEPLRLNFRCWRSRSECVQCDFGQTGPRRQRTWQQSEHSSSRHAPLARLGPNHFRWPRTQIHVAANAQHTCAQTRFLRLPTNYALSAQGCSERGHGPRCSPIGLSSEIGDHMTTRSMLATALQPRRGRICSKQAPLNTNPRFACLFSLPPEKIPFLRQARP